MDSQCAECGKLMCVWNGDTDTAFQVCFTSGTCHVMCPFWRPGLGPDWTGRARGSEEWRRRKLAEKVARESESLPE